MSQWGTFSFKVCLSVPPPSSLPHPSLSSSPSSLFQLSARIKPPCQAWFVKPIFPDEFSIYHWSTYSLPWICSLWNTMWAWNIPLGLLKNESIFFLHIWISKTGLPLTSYLPYHHKLSPIPSWLEELVERRVSWLITVMSPVHSEHYDTSRSKCFSNSLPLLWLIFTHTILYYLMTHVR